MKSCVWMTRICHHALERSAATAELEAAKMLRAFNLKDVERA
jgi:hypothetical protein